VKKSADKDVDALAEKASDLKLDETKVRSLPPSSLTRYDELSRSHRSKVPNIRMAGGIPHSTPSFHNV
jgi:hypothetical protein